MYWLRRIFALPLDKYELCIFDSFISIFGNDYFFYFMNIWNNEKWALGEDIHTHTHACRLLSRSCVGLLSRGAQGSSHLSVHLKFTFPSFGTVLINSEVQVVETVPKPSTIYYSASGWNPMSLQQAWLTEVSGTCWERQACCSPVAGPVLAHGEALAGHLTPVSLDTCPPHSGSGCGGRTWS